MLHARDRDRDYCSSTDSQFTENDEEEITFLEACMECDEDALYDIIQDGVTYEQVNERDRSGRTALSLACGSGFMPILELLAEVEEVDVNLPDNEGNTPLIFASQAGHADVVNFLLNHFRRIKIDQANAAGFTPLMKAAVQGRTRSAKLLLFAGANPNRRDHGRGLCAEEWAKFTGREACATAISKYVHSKKYFLKKTFLMTREKWSSEPDLWKKGRHKEMTKGDKGGAKGWVTRHLSFKRKRTAAQKNDDMSASLDESSRSTSSPQLTIEVSSPPGSPKAPRRPSCIDGVVPLNIIPKRFAAKQKNFGVISEDEDAEDTVKAEPPTILKTDFDEEDQSGQPSQKQQPQDQTSPQGAEPTSQPSPPSSNTKPTFSKPTSCDIKKDTLGGRNLRTGDRVRRLKKS